jgi:hypothetical protein
VAEKYDHHVESAADFPARTAWMLVGALLSFAVITGFSIGFAVAPLALLGVWLAIRRAGVGPQTFGLLDGAAGICLVVALLNREGTRDPIPWAIAAAVLAALGFVGYRLSRRAFSRDT